MVEAGIIREIEPNVYAVVEEKRVVSLGYMAKKDQCTPHKLINCILCHYKPKKSATSQTAKKAGSGNRL
jgi:hypothetical protein